MPTALASGGVARAAFSGTAATADCPECCGTGCALWWLAETCPRDPNEEIPEFCPLPTPLQLYVCTAVVCASGAQLDTETVFVNPNDGLCYRIISPNPIPAAALQPDIRRLDPVFHEVECATDCFDTICPQRGAFAKVVMCEDPTLDLNLWACTQAPCPVFKTPLGPGQVLTCVQISNQTSPTLPPGATFIDPAAATFLYGSCCECLGSCTENGPPPPGFGEDPACYAQFILRCCCEDPTTTRLTHNFERYEIYRPNDPVEWGEVRVTGLPTVCDGTNNGAIAHYRYSNPGSDSTSGVACMELQCGVNALFPDNLPASVWVYGDSLCHSVPGVEVIHRIAVTCDRISMYHRRRYDYGGGSYAIVVSSLSFRIDGVSRERCDPCVNAEAGIEVFL